MSEADHFGWLIGARSDSQSLLLRLYRFGHGVSNLEDHETARRLYAHLVGAAFSLWRAAFLSDSTRQWREILRGNRGALKFLEKVLRDNAINYPQDRDTRDWMGGYYLNSARFRLVRVRQRLAEIVPESRDSERFKSLDELDADGTTGRKATECWYILHGATTEAVDQLERLVSRA
jgi:hypothetical protein